MIFDYLYEQMEEKRLETEAGCMEALFHARWPNGFACPRCGCRSAYVISSRRLPLYECRDCRAQTSLISGTVMEGSRTSLVRWFKAIRYLSQPHTVNAKQIAGLIGVTYKTAWLMCHKIREAMIAAEAAQPLDGQVRATDLLIRSIPAQVNGNFQPQEQVVTIGVSDNADGKPDRIKLQQRPKSELETRYSPAPAEPFLKLHVLPGPASRATILPRHIHGKGKEELRKLRRDLCEIGWELQLWLSFRFGGIKPKHLQRYLHHFGFRWNRRFTCHFGELLEFCAGTRVITYPSLTQKSLQPRPAAASHALPYQAA